MREPRALARSGDGHSDTIHERHGESLLDAGIVDSTGVLELVSFVERTFDLRVEDHELLPDNFDSIERLSAFVRRKRNGAAA